MARFTPPEDRPLTEKFVHENFPHYDASVYRQKLRAARRLLKDDTPEQEAADLEALQEWATANPLHPKVKSVPTPEMRAWARRGSEMFKKARKECDETI